MSRTRVHNLFCSLDGYAAGDVVTLEQPIGDAGALFAGFDGRAIHGVDGAEAPIGLDRALTSLWGQGIGVEIMGRRKFGPQSGPWTDDGWRGWWGAEPPFRTPVIVLTHFEREPITFDNGTSFHFVDATPAQALELAEQLAPGQDVRLGGGPSTIRQFLAADLVDFLHLVTRPVVLGHGVSLWEGLRDVQQRFTVETFPAASGNVHQLWNRIARD